jgi:hypothetical protein
VCASFNIYCDESCHLPHDHQSVMVLGALKLPTELSGEVSARIREIKANHGLHPAAELKWGKISPRWLPVYEAIIDYFFTNDALGFRAVVAQKADLDHTAFDQTHDDWYYKMYYLLLSNLLETQHDYRVYLDIKDTRGGPKVRHLHRVLCSGMYDFHEESLQRIQTVRSHEVQALQLVDVLIGAVGFANRQNANPSAAKLALVRRIEAASRKRLTRSTPPREAKFNVFHWTGRAAY